MMDQISTNSIFLIRFALLSHVIPGHQAKWIGMTLQEAIQDGLFNASFRKCNELLKMTGEVISTKSTRKLKCSTVFIYFSLFEPPKRILVSSQNQRDKKVIILSLSKKFCNVSDFGQNFVLIQN